MKTGFSHIFRSVTISALMAGFMAHLVLPFSSHAQKTAFTQWLDHHVVATGDENEIHLRKTIRELPERAGDFWGLLLEASDLVINHQEDFRIRPFLPENRTEETHRPLWLIGQWKLFQHQQTGTNAILPEIPQPVQKWISSNNISPLPFSLTEKRAIRDLADEIVPPFTLLPDRAIIPLVNGISIHAP